MALCTTGSISLGGSTEGRSVNLELAKSATAQIGMNDADARGLAEKASGAIAMSDFYGKSSAPTAFGEVFNGGIYMGTINAAGSSYYLLVAPNATGCACCIWKTTNTATSGTSSCVDGYSNTYGPMDNANHPAGNWCATRTINGFSDWYLPAIDELEVFYDNGGTDSDVIGTGETFAGGQFWSSTEHDIPCACFFGFFSFFGSKFYNCKTISQRVRAGRREPI